MIGGMLWAGSALFTHAEIFWPETVAIVALAVSWLTQGEADYPIRQGVMRLVSGPASDPPKPKAA